MTIDKEKLKALAQAAATHVSNDDEYRSPGYDKDCWHDDVCDFANAMSPGAVLALLAEIERGNRLFAATCLALGSVGEALGIPGEEQEGGACELIEAIDRLKAENEALRIALGDLLSLYEDDEGCRWLPEYIAGRAAMTEEKDQ